MATDLSTSRPINNPGGSSGTANNDLSVVRRAAEKCSNEQIKERLDTSRYDTSLVSNLNGKDVDLRIFQKDGFTNPILIENSKSLPGLRDVPAASEKLIQEATHILQEVIPCCREKRIPNDVFSFSELKKIVGQRRFVKVFNSFESTTSEMTIKEWLSHFFTPSSRHTGSAQYINNADLSRTKLASMIEPPDVVTQLDWSNAIFSSGNGAGQQTSCIYGGLESDSCADRHKLQRLLCMGMEGSFTDFQFGSSGASMWYHVISGEQFLWLVAPSPENHDRYVRWMTHKDESTGFYADLCGKDCQALVLKPGATIFIPPGWIYARYFMQDTIAISGLFLHSFSVDSQLATWHLEDLLQRAPALRYPRYVDTHWFVLASYSSVLTCDNSDIASGSSESKGLEQDQNKKNDGSLVGSSQGQKDSENKNESEGDGSLKRKQDGGSTVSDKDEQQSTDLVPAKKLRISSDKIAGDSESADNSDDPRKRESSLFDSSQGGIETDLEVLGRRLNKKYESQWMHVSRLECEGVRAVVDFLEVIGAQSAPRDIENPKETLRRASLFVAAHETDDNNKAITGHPVLFICPSNCHHKAEFSKMNTKQTRLHQTLRDGSSPLSFASSTSLSSPALVADSPTSALQPLQVSVSGSSSANHPKRRRVRCKKCEKCTSTECGECMYCQDMKKFGGQGRLKQTCVSRQCIAPILPTAAICLICKHGDESESADKVKDTAELSHVGGAESKEGGENRVIDGSGSANQTTEKQAGTDEAKTGGGVSDGAGGGATSVTDTPASELEFKTGMLMECGICWKICHPACLRLAHPGLVSEGIINDDLPNSWECPLCCEDGRHGHGRARVTKSHSYSGRHTPSAKSSTPSPGMPSTSAMDLTVAEPLALDLSSTSASDVQLGSRSAGLDLTFGAYRGNLVGEKGSKLKSRGGYSHETMAVKTEMDEIKEEDSKSLPSSSSHDLNQIYQSSAGPSHMSADHSITDSHSSSSGQLSVPFPPTPSTVPAIGPYVVRPLPCPPPPKHVVMTTGHVHVMDREAWLKVFEWLNVEELAACMAVCKTWNRWAHDQRLWKRLVISRRQIKKHHLIGIVRRQPKNLDISWTNVSHRQLSWLHARLPHLKGLSLAGNAWPAVSALALPSAPHCPLLLSLDLSWVASVNDACLIDLLRPPPSNDAYPALIGCAGGSWAGLSRLRRCEKMGLAGAEITDKSLTTISRYLTQLRVLDLSYCVMVTDTGIKALFTSGTGDTSCGCTSLSQLVLTGCARITGSLLSWLCKCSADNLRVLRIERCPAITEQHRAEFTRRYPQCNIVWKDAFDLM